MKPRRYLFGFAALLLVAGAFVEYRILTSQRAELAKLATESARLDGVLRKQREDLAATRRQFQELEREAERSRAAAAAAEAASAMKLWAGRIALLKRLFTEMPSQHLPELRLLEPIDWIAVVRKRELDSPQDIRSAFATARAVGLKKMGGALLEALRAYAAQNAGELPREIDALAAHLAPPADLEMLRRYKLMRSGPLDANDDPILREIAPLDIVLTVNRSGYHLRSNGDWTSPDNESESILLKRAGEAMNTAFQSTETPGFDKIFSVTQLISGLKEMSDQLSPKMDELFSAGMGAQLKQAAKRFHAERGTYPENIADLAAYVENAALIAPLARPLIARLEYMHDHQGEAPTDPAQLQRYLDRPFEDMSILRAMKLSFDGDKMSMDMGFSFSSSKTTTTTK